MPDFFKVPAWVLKAVVGLGVIGVLVTLAIVFSPNMTTQVRNGLLSAGLIVWAIFVFVLWQLDAIKSCKE